MQQLVDNRYRIESQIGSGGMAEVYLARDEVLDRDVALKVMNPYYAGDEEFVERFKQEARSAASLSHPNIVSIYDRGMSDEGTYYIAMEYVSGGTLKDRIVKRGAFAPRTAAAVALQIAEALQAAHRRGVVHRDIKPQNILVTAAGDVKVTDFGIARAAAASSTMTRTGTVLGTAHYISPEQAMGEEVGPQSDLYSLGVILYEMLTGELPYEGDSTLGVAMKHVNGRLTPPQEVNPQVPDGLNAVVVRLLSKYPTDRYTDAAELIRDLERIRDGMEPASAATTQVMQRVAAGDMQQTLAGTPVQRRKRSRAKPILLGMLVVALLALLGWGGYTYLPELTSQGQMTRVPDFTGKTLQDARQQAGEDFNISVSDRVESEEPVDTVLEQDPSSGEQAEKGSTISVVVSGTQVVEVPDVTGDSAGEARDTLTQEDFEVQTEQRESSSEDEGNVIAQSPSGGQNAEKGSTVTLTVGAGPSTVEVPDLTGQSVSQAQSTLASSGLSLGDQSETASDSIPEGGIVSQNPSAGTGVAPETAVSVTVSTGPSQVEVPDVTGEDINTARQEILNAGLGYTTTQTYSNQPAGTVISQSPSGGAEVDPGTYITLTESLGRQPAPSPTPDNGSSSPGGQSGGEQQPSNDSGDDNGGGSEDSGDDNSGSNKPKRDNNANSSGSGGGSSERGRGSGGDNQGDDPEPQEPPPEPDLPSDFPFD